jgi:hypothetical protein
MNWRHWSASFKHPFKQRKTSWNLTWAI